MALTTKQEIMVRLYEAILSNPNAGLNSAITSDNNFKNVCELAQRIYNRG